MGAGRNPEALHILTVFKTNGNKLKNVAFLSKYQIIKTIEEWTCSIS
jgi:hypothetical protein